MADDHDHDHDHDDGHEANDHGETGETRVTAPMQAFTDREVGIGIAVLVVGLVLTFGLGLALA